MNAEDQWSKALRDTEISPISRISLELIGGGLLGGIVVGGCILHFGVGPYWATIGGIGAVVVGCLIVLKQRGEKVKRRQSFVDMLMAKIHDNMDTQEFIAVLSALGDLGSTASRALPLIEAIEHANSGSSAINDACKSARIRITGTEQAALEQPLRADQFR